MTLAKTGKNRSNLRMLTVLEGNPPLIHYSIYGGLCTNVKVVRERLNSGVLAKIYSQSTSVNSCTTQMIPPA